MPTPHGDRRSRFRATDARPSLRLQALAGARVLNQERREGDAASWRRSPSRNATCRAASQARGSRFFAPCSCSSEPNLEALPLEPAALDRPTEPVTGGSHAHLMAPCRHCGVARLQGLVEAGSGPCDWCDPSSTQSRSWSARVSASRWLRDHPLCRQLGGGRRARRRNEVRRDDRVGCAPHQGRPVTPWSRRRLGSSLPARAARHSQRARS